MQRAADRHDACEKTIADAFFQQLRAPSLCLEMGIVPDAPEATGAAGAADSGARQEAGESFFHQRADRRIREKGEVVPCPWRRTHITRQFLTCGTVHV
jgi:hypothetical protein